MLLIEPHCDFKFASVFSLHSIDRNNPLLTKFAYIYTVYELTVGVALRRVLSLSPHNSVASLKANEEKLLNIKQQSVNIGRIMLNKVAKCGIMWVGCADYWHICIVWMLFAAIRDFGGCDLRRGFYKGKRDRSQGAIDGATQPLSRKGEKRWKKLQKERLSGWLLCGFLLHFLVV